MKNILILLLTSGTKKSKKSDSLALYQSFKVSFFYNTEEINVFDLLIDSSTTNSNMTMTINLETNLSKERVRIKLPQ